MHNKVKNLFLMLCLLPAACMVQRVNPPVAPPAASPDQIRVVADMVNRHREKVGCKPLSWLSPVAAVAQKHSQDMAFHQYFSHKNLLGETPFDRLTKAGIKYRKAAENIAAGQTSAAQVVASWLQSSGHRRNIEDCGLQNHGIGLYQNHWTHVFVTLPPR
jgi:uncharacterized protein YkwD